MKLVLIESSGKQESIQKYLGKDYKVFATKGHIRDLPVRTLGVDVNQNFKPDYQIMSDKKKLVSQMETEAKKADEIFRLLLIYPTVFSGLPSKNAFILL